MQSQSKNSASLLPGTLDHEVRRHPLAHITTMREITTAIMQLHTPPMSYLNCPPILCSCFPVTGCYVFKTLFSIQKIAGYCDLSLLTLIAPNSSANKSLLTVFLHSAASSCGNIYHAGEFVFFTTHHRLELRIIEGRLNLTAIMSAQFDANINHAGQLVQFTTHCRRDTRMIEAR